MIGLDNQFLFIVLSGHLKQVLLYSYIYCILFCRCYYIGQSYEVTKKWKEAIGLYDRVLDYCNNALDGFKQLPKDHQYLYKVSQWLPNFTEDTYLWIDEILDNKTDTEILYRSQHNGMRFWYMVH